MVVVVVVVVMLAGRRRRRSHGCCRTRVGGLLRGMDGMDLNTGQFVFGSEMDPYLDLDPYVDPKVEVHEQNSSGTADGVVPVQSNKLGFQVPALVNDNCSFELDFSTGSKSFGGGYGYNSSLSQSVSSSSLDVGVVPDGSTLTDISNSYSSRSVSNGIESAKPDSATVGS
ncbi:ZINC FINGER PROTEIN CONSTANS-LIKE 4-LIKE [Salix koriyanagi]|uniref:ZINC FINGER PROTEIN CONSTANS-LIKE 4-LIKE n=1 Tax=Salix koriyanagi TaxID=2511006 RepID=A0A9Q0W145_9ROSI|nr:ZINC FINGER PROTEIN CONSTANS-LIKE 4-LIKE [Salix koriyanagi]